MEPERPESTSAPRPGGRLVLRCTRWWSAAFLVLGALWLVLRVLDSRAWQIVIGVVWIVLASLWGSRPAAEIVGGELLVRGVNGPRVRGRYPVTGPSDLAIRGYHLVHLPSDQQVLDLGSGVRRSDVRRWREWLREAAGDV